MESSGKGLEAGLEQRLVPAVEQYELDGLVAFGQEKGNERETSILFVEQPVEGLRAMSAAPRAVDTDVMADEGAWSPDDVVDIASAGAASLISLYTTKLGGLHRAAKVAAVAEAHGFACSVNGSAETGVGNAANLHLSAAMKAVSLACVVPVSAPAESRPTETVGCFYMDDIITEPFGYEDGALIVPTGPGLGIGLTKRRSQPIGKELRAG